MISAIVVEDNKSKQNAIQNVLEKYNVVVTVAKNIQEAKKLLQKNCFDIAVIDLALPIWEDGETKSEAGIELIREIHNLEGYYIPRSILAITQYDEYLHQAESLKEFGVVLHKYEANRDVAEQISSYIIKAMKSNQQISFDYDVCIIAALEKEAQPFFELFSDVVDCENFVHQNFLYKKAYFRLKEETLKVAIVTLPRMGLVNSALYTARSINLLKPKLIIMSGICAGIKKDGMELGDLIVAEICWEWQVGKITDQGLLNEPYQIEIGEFSKTLVRNYEKTVLDKFWKEQSIRPLKKSGIHFGAVVSGSSVIASDETIKTISQQHRKILGLEMEIYGVYAASRIGWPRPHFFAIKSICDFADEEKGDDFQNYCAGISAHFIVNLLKKNFQRIKSMG